MRRVLAFVLFVAAGVWTPATHADTPAARYADGRVTADVRDVELAGLIGEIASQAGFEIRGTPAPRMVTVRLDGVPLADALTKILEGQRVAYTYDRRGGLKRVEFFEVGTAVVPAPPAAPHPAPSEAGVAPPGVAARDRPVPIEGLLASALGASESTFAQIVGVALQAGDARLRKEALRAALALLDADKELQADVSETLDALDDDALAARLREIAGVHAEETAQQTARLAHWKPLRRRAVAVLRLVRTDG